MPRVGQNPMKWVKDVHQPEKVTVTTAVYIPFLDGYWTQSLEVLKLCFQSLHENTQQPFDLVVFDNGSCVEVQDYLLDLRRKGWIQYLVLSGHNVGKVRAWNVLFSAAPGEIVSYADSDVYFLPGWLEATIEVLEAFPEAGMVTAQPGCGPLTPRRLSTLTAAQKSHSISIREGDDLIPERYVNAFRNGLGETQEEFEQRIRGRRDVLLTRGTVRAYASASHFQFTTTRKVLQSISPLKVKGARPIGDVGHFDDAIDRAGFWRLSTTDYLVHHMGNRVPDFHEELPRINGQSNVPRTKSGSGDLRPIEWFLRRSIVRHFLKRVNVLSYELLYK